MSCNGPLDCPKEVSTRGDRTMLDALLPAAVALQKAVHSDRNVRDAHRAAAAAAAAGARATADLMPRRGRSSYLGERALGYPDPGAEVVAVWLNAVSQVVVGSDTANSRKSKRMGSPGGTLNASATPLRSIPRIFPK